MDNKEPISKGVRELNITIALYMNMIMLCLAILCGRSIFWLYTIWIIDVLATSILISVKPLTPQRLEGDKNMCQACFA